MFIISVEWPSEFSLTGRLPGQNKQGLSDSWLTLVLRSCLCI